MASDDVDRNRRRFLTRATTVVGGAGVVAVAVPFLASMSTSARATAAGAPVEADISKLEPGQKVIYKWRGQPVILAKRTERLMETLKNLAPRLVDPMSKASEQPPYAQNIQRAREERPDVLVMILICTHLGCSPTWRPEKAPPDLGPDWPGGFFCPCHGSRYDSAGRVFQGQPAPKNMAIPPYVYVSDNRVKIGDDKRG